MHNSIWIRERLRATNQDPLHVSRRDPHRCVAPDPASRGGAGAFRLEGSWAVVSSAGSPGIAELVEDLSDYLGRMGVAVSRGGVNHIYLDLDQAIDHHGFRLTSKPDCIRIRSRCMDGLWAGAAYLEREMGMQRGPFLPEMDASIGPAWDTEVGQSPWGSNYLLPDISEEYLSNDAFRLLAHYGVNGMTVYGDLLLYARSRILPELDHPRRDEWIPILRDATERAARYGISLYWVPILPKLAEDHVVFINHPNVRGALLSHRPGGRRLHSLCSSDPESLSFLAEVIEGVFRDVPLLGGLILIIGGESYYHCYMRPDLEGIGPGQRRTNCQRCARRPAEEVVAAFVGNTADAVHRAKPEAMVAAWPYSAHAWSQDPHQLGLVRLLPDEVGLLSEIDKDQIYRKNGYSKHIWDYSVDFTGPSDRIKAQAGACDGRGLALYIKTETALGLEAIHMPYVPCLNRLAEKWRNVLGMAPDGVLQSWMFFGMWGSRAEELAWWTRWRSDIPPDEVLTRIARRDFGSAQGRVLAAWREMSEAVGHLPFIPPYFMGAWFLGPAHPLLREGDPVPREFTGALYYLQEAEESLSAARLDNYESLVLTRLPDSPAAWGFHCDDGDAWSRAIGEMEEALAHSERALNAIGEALSITRTEADSVRLREEHLHIEFFHRTMVSVHNTLGFLSLEEGDAEIPSILECELDNARKARRIYQEAPWLDLSLRVDAGFPSCVDMLESKIRLLEVQLS
jgi:hypothetical protein